MGLGDRLRLTWDVAPDVLDACVPHTLLQPLVENATKYGLEARSDAGRIMVSARRDGDMLCLTIRDDGPGLDAESPRRGPGVGITNVRTRLAQLYGDRRAFRRSNAPGGGPKASSSCRWARGKSSTPHSPEPTGCGADAWRRRVTRRRRLPPPSAR